MNAILAIVYNIIIFAFCSLLVLQRVQLVLLCWTWRYSPATNRNTRTRLVFVSSRTDLLIKDKLLVNKRKQIQMQGKTVRKTDGFETFGVCTVVLLKSQVFWNMTLL
jgi:hypothetical protein